MIYPNDRRKSTASLIFIYPLYFHIYIFFKNPLRFFRNNLLLPQIIFTLIHLLGQHLSSAANTLRFSWCTLSLRPRAAATKNKTRMAEKGFINLLQVKNISWTGSTLQIYMSSIKDPIKLFLVKYVALITFIGGMSVPDDG